MTGMSYLDCSATLDAGRRRLYLSLVNRHRDDALEVGIDIPDAKVRSDGAAFVLHHDDPMAMNTPAAPDNVRVASTTAAGCGAHFVRALPPHSYTILELDLA